MFPLCLDATVPLATPAEPLHLPTTCTSSDLLWREETPSRSIHRGLQLMLPLLFPRPLQPRPLKAAQKILPLLGQGTMMIMIKHVFPVSSPPP